MVLTPKYNGFHAQICNQIVLYILILYVPILRDVSSYVKVYTYFIVLFTNILQGWEPITVITVHDFLYALMEGVFAHMCDIIFLLCIRGSYKSCSMSSHY